MVVNKKCCPEVFDQTRKSYFNLGNKESKEGMLVEFCIKKGTLSSNVPFFVHKGLLLKTSKFVEGFISFCNHLVKNTIIVLF